MNLPTPPFAELTEQQTKNFLSRLASAEPDFQPLADALAELSELALSDEQQAEMARDTLAVLAEQSPERAEVLVLMINNPASQRFDGGMTIATLVGVAVLLRTHVKFERDKDGKWQLMIEHKPVTDGLLDKLIKKIEALLARQ